MEQNKMMNKSAIKGALGLSEQSWREISAPLSFLPEGGYGIAVRLLSPSVPGQGGGTFCLGRGGEPFRAASVIKAGISACLFSCAQEGLLDLGSGLTAETEDIVEGGVICELAAPHIFSLLELARLMMTVSDNTASNMLLRLLGKDRVNAFLRERLGLGRSVINRYFMHSPELEGENYTSAEDCVIMLSQLWGEGILSGWYREEFWKIMSRQMFIEKLPGCLPDTVKCYNKTGELDDGVRSDIGVFQYGSMVWSAAFLTDQVTVSAAKTDRIIADFSENLFNGLINIYNNLQGE